MDMPSFKQIKDDILKENDLIDHSLIEDIFNRIGDRINQGIENICKIINSSVLGFTVPLDNFVIYLKTMAGDILK